MIVDVVFHWDDRMGECYDCGRPSAWEGRDEGERYCGVCAAHHLAGGEPLRWLFEEDR